MKRKVKKFRAGGDYDSSDDARNLLRAAEREAREFKGMDTDVIDETGMKSRLKRNMETGELYDPTGETSSAKVKPSKQTVKTTPTSEPRKVVEQVTEQIKEGKTSSGSPREARGSVAKLEIKSEAPKQKTFAEKQSAAGEKMKSAYRSSAEDLKSSLRKLFTPSANNPRIRRELAEGTRIRSEMKKGGMVSSASKRADGIAQRGKTRGRMV